VAFNVLFLVMGLFARITHLPLTCVFHLFRAGLGIALLVAVYKFSGLFLDKPGQRRILIPLVGLSAGLGWLMPNAGAPTGPVDNWQPEAITFLSIYLNPLFLAGQILMLGAFYFLLLAQREGRARHAVSAGLCLLLLGNVHTYDVVTMAFAWFCYLIVLWAVEGRFPKRIVLLSLLAVVIALPSVAYQFYVYAVDPVFRERANTPAPSPPIWSFLMGYGLVLVGALGGWLLRLQRFFATRRLGERPESSSALFLGMWAIAAFNVVYLPVSQQRKLIMGTHIPLCILCAYLLSSVLAKLPRYRANVILFALISIMAISNLRFIVRDAVLLNQGRTVTHIVPFMSRHELAAMRYLRVHAGSRDCVFAPPTFSQFAPAFAGVTVYYGHWSETPDYAEKMTRWSALADTNLSDNAFSNIVLDSKADYYVSEARVTDPPARHLPSVLELCYRSGPVRVYKVHRVSESR